MRRRAALIAILLMLGGAGLLAGYFGLRPIPYDVPKDDTATDAVTADKTSPPAEPDDPLRGVVPTPEGRKTESGVTIDLARVSTDGASVFAGRSEPNSYVTVFDGDTPIGSAKADAGGEWSLATEHKFASLDPKLSYKSSSEPPAEVASAGAAGQAGSDSARDRVAAAAPAAPTPAPEKPRTAAGAPQTVTKELLKKFEGMVAEAREEAKKEREAASAKPSAPPSGTGSSPAEAPSPPSTSSQTAAAPAPSAEAGGASSPPSPDSASTPAAAGGAERPAPGQESAPSSPGSTAGAPSTSSAPAAVAANEPQRESDRASAAPTAAPAQGDVSIPVPIMFVYNESTFTEDGRKAADLLLEYLQLKHPKSVTLSGHADERGSDEYNMDLSRERLEAVENYLQSGGFTGELNLVPKGKSEPFMGVDRSKYHGEALYQLDRRVELRLLR